MVTREYAAGVLLLACGCLAHRDSEKVVDPTLHSQGSTFERARSAGGFALGPYRISTQRLKRWPAGDRSVAGATPDSAGHPGEFIELDARVQTDGAVWSIRCEAVREPTASSDYGAVLDENTEAVSIDCEFWDDTGDRWKFATRGLLSENLGGKLEPVATSVTGGALDVEILMWRRRFDRINRHIPHAVAQVRAGRTTVAAMILARPERAWVATSSTQPLRDIAMVTLVALRLLPIGFEG